VLRAVGLRVRSDSLRDGAFGRRARHARGAGARRAAAFDLTLVVLLLQSRHALHRGASEAGPRRCIRNGVFVNSSVWRSRQALREQRGELLLLRPIERAFLRALKRARQAAERLAKRLHRPGKLAAADAWKSRQRIIS